MNLCKKVSNSVTFMQKEVSNLTIFMQKKCQIRLILLTNGLNSVKFNYKKMHKIKLVE